MKRIYAHLRLHELPASVEAEERNGQPVVLYDETGQRVLSASPEAMRRGVRPTMSRWEAERACPDLHAVEPAPEKYAYFRQRALEICGDYSPATEIREMTLGNGNSAVTLDFRLSNLDLSLDLTGVERLFGSAKEIALEVRNRLRVEVGVIASVGIGPNRMIARLASESAMPGAVVEIRPEQTAHFVSRLPITALPGVDYEQAQRLADLGIRSAGELVMLPADAVERAFGEWGRRLHIAAKGEEPTGRTRNEATLEEGRTEDALAGQIDLRPSTTDRMRIRSALRAAADDVARALRQHGKVARHIELVIVFSDMRAVGARRTLGHATRSGEVVFHTAGALFERMKLGGRLVRRIRVLASRMAVGPNGGQLGLPIQEREQRRERLAERVNQLKDRFGETAVLRASSFDLTRR